MGLLWRLFAPRPLKKARRALHPSWVIEDAIVHSVRKGRRQRGRQRRAPRPRPQMQIPRLAEYGAQLTDTATGRTWRCSHDHITEADASRCADEMEERISRLGWEEATRAWPQTAASLEKAVVVAGGAGPPRALRPLAREREVPAPARRPGHYLTWLISCSVGFIGAWVGINQAPARSGLSYTMGWTMAISFAGALVSLIRFLGARRRLRKARLQ